MGSGEVATCSLLLVRKFLTEEGNVRSLVTEGQGRGDVRRVGMEVPGLGRKWCPSVPCSEGLKLGYHFLRWWAHRALGPFAVYFCLVLKKL